MNKHLLHGIHKAGTTMHICCTARVTTNLQGWLGDFPKPVWYIPQGVANILLFFLVQKYYWIQCNTSKYNTFLVTKPTGTRITFEPTGKGLYTLTTPSSGLAFFGVSTKGDHSTDWVHINTVNDHKCKYTKCECDAVLAWKIQNIIMFLGVQGFTKIMDSQLIANLPIG